ncbi:MAG: dTDP-4-dehydrorhamnose 3,5-epimerase [Microgenomates group bacterium]
MIFNKTPLAGLYEIELEKRQDERGFFARFFCVNEYKDRSLENKIVQINNSFTLKKHTLRGLHYQVPPKAEERIVRCLRGSILDMSLDLRPKSPTFGKWHSVKLTSDNRKMIYIPKGFAHGFMTLEDDTEILYLVTELYSPEHERVIRWDDPAFGMKWPEKPKDISKKDSEQSDFDPEFHLKGMETIKI